MRNASELTEKAKKGDKNARLILFEYYKVYFIDAVQKRYGDEFKELAGNDFEKIFNYYFDKGIREKIGNYLKKRSKTIYNSYFKEESLSSKVIQRSDDNIKYLINYYKPKIIEETFLKYNDYLSYDEIEKYIDNYLDDFFITSGLSSSCQNVLSMASSLLKRERKLLNDKENFFKKYIMYNGLNDNIINYFVNKYSYLLDKYRYTKYYTCLSYEFEIIVGNALSKLENMHIGIESELKKEIYLRKDSLREEIRKLQKKTDLTTIQKEKLYLSHEYIKEYVYRDYKNKFKMDIKNDIINKYNDFFNAYINSSRNIDLSGYLFTRYQDYFKKKKDISYVDNDKLQENVNKYYYIYLNCIDKVKGYYPSKKVLEESYIAICKRYFEKNLKSNFTSYINISMKYALNYYDNYYNEKYLDDVISKVISKNIIPKDIVYDYLSELKKYYLENKIYEEEFFEKYLYNEINKFNYDEYLKISEVKRYYDNGLCKRSKKWK